MILIGMFLLIAMLIIMIEIWRDGLMEDGGIDDVVSTRDFD